MKGDMDGKEEVEETETEKDNDGWIENEGKPKRKAKKREKYLKNHAMQREMRNTRRRRKTP